VTKNKTNKININNAVGTRNKEQVGKYRIVPYCESDSFIKLNFGKHQHSVIASFYTIAESLIVRFDCIT